MGQKCLQLSRFPEWEQVNVVPGPVPEAGMKLGSHRTEEGQRQS